MCYITSVKNTLIDNIKNDVTEFCKDEFDLIVIRQLLLNMNIGELTPGMRDFPKEQIR